MGEVKVFRIRGEVPMGVLRSTFVKEVRALKLEHALERIYSEFGSRHKVKRSRIKIISIEEVSEDP